MLGALGHFSESDRVEAAEMPELERWVLHRLWQLDRHLRQACDDFQFHPVFAELHNFCTVDLSALYFDVRKDSLYCDPAGDPKRRAARKHLAHQHRAQTAALGIGAQVHRDFGNVVVRRARAEGAEVRIAKESFLGRGSRLDDKDKTVLLHVRRAAARHLARVRRRQFLRGAVLVRYPSLAAGPARRQRAAYKASRGVQHVGFVDLRHCAHVGLERVARRREGGHEEGGGGV